VLLLDEFEQGTETAPGGVALARDPRPAGFARSVDAQTDMAAMNLLARRPTGDVLKSMPLPPAAVLKAREARPAAPGPVRAKADELVQHMPRLRSVIRRILPDETDAEDALQDVMLTALRKLGTFRGDAQLGTWLHRIAVNAALQRRRRKAQTAKAEPLRVDENRLAFQRPIASVLKKTPRPDQETMQHEGSRLIQAAIAKLPPLYRDVYLLADVDDQPNEQIARDLRLKLAAVKSRLHRARKMMRDQLAPHFEA
jgi:RNA polymerase sigma-70 factor (ECF subfamily)